MKQNPVLALAAWVSMLCLLLLALTPAACAARVHGAPKAMHRMRWMPRVENGIVTDGDGIIGNGARGADHARHARRPRPAHMMTGSDVPPDPTLPELPQNGGTGSPSDNGVNGNMNDLPDGMGATPDHAGDPIDGQALNDGDRGNTANDTDGNLANDTASGGEGGADVTDGAAANGVLPWIIGIIVLLAVVLIVLSLMPKRKRNS